MRPDKDDDASPASPASSHSVANLQLDPLVEPWNGMADDTLNVDDDVSESLRKRKLTGAKTAYEGA